MAVLEMVPLRSKLPYAGRVTLRHAVPIILPAGALDLRVESTVRSDTTTTPQVAPASDEAGETTAGKGGEAR
jgi:hypothetical protein